MVLPLLRQILFAGCRQRFRGWLPSPQQVAGHRASFACRALRASPCNTLHSDVPYNRFMLQRLLSLVGLTASELPGKHSPYSQRSINRIYNQLFCDDLELFRPKAGTSPAAWQSVLISATEDSEAVLVIAEDPANEGRVRALAYNWLRARQHEVPKQVLLGVVVEVPLDGGLDTLAAYSDGGVRYINQTGKLAVIEGDVSQVKPLLEGLLAVSREAISNLGPWNEERKPPPPRGSVRLSFLVSDGLYFGQGPLELMAKDAMGGPILEQATRLLQCVVQNATKPT
jgi:hypothetical protein